MGSPDGYGKLPSPLGRGCPAAGAFTSRSGPGEGLVSWEGLGAWSEAIIRRTLLLLSRFSGSDFNLTCMNGTVPLNLRIRLRARPDAGSLAPQS
jgi:hypothetical protein